MEIKLIIEVDAIKKRISNFKKIVKENKKNIAFGLIAIYCFASILYIAVDFVIDSSSWKTFEGQCTNVSDHNLTIDGMTITFFHTFSPYEIDLMENNRIKIECMYSKTTNAWHWRSIENLDY